MIDIRITRDGKGIIRRIAVSGHSGFGKKGSDIVCAAVSVTMYTAAGALEDLAGLEGCYAVEDGFMEIRVPENLSDKQAATAEIIMETTAIGLKQVEMEYGKYVEVLDEEV